MAFRKRHAETETLSGNSPVVKSLATKKLSGEGKEEEREAPPQP